MDKLRALADRSFSTHIIPFLILLLAAVLIYDRQFIQDDAYISFIYARNFAEGNGLNWYPGSTEYGYSNFLFTLLVGMLMKVGVGVPAAAYLLTVPASLITLLLVYKIGSITTGSTLVGLLAMLSLATNYSYTAYATGGLETSLVLSFIMAAHYCAIRWRNIPHSMYLWGMGCFSALALLARLDSVLLLIPPYIMILHGFYRAYQTGTSFTELYNRLIAIAMIPLIALFFFFVFCMAYYGQLLPNTFYVKATSWHIMSGIHYLHTFLLAQYYAPVLLFLIWFYLASSKDFDWNNWGARILWISCIIIWCAYIMKIGGDFMEFRFILPLLPFLYLLFFDLIVHLAKRKTAMPVIIAATVALTGNILQPLYFVENDGFDSRFLESTDHLDSWLTEPNMNWILVGKRLNKLFYTGKETDVRIAVTAAGAIPYYSRLRAIDQHGLNTRGVLKNSDKVDITRPGHMYWASESFMRQSGVNLIIAHPIFIKKRILKKDKKTRYICADEDALPSHDLLWHIPTVLIHIHDDIYMLAHYLLPHKRIEDLLKKKVILRYRDIFEQTNCGNHQKEVMTEVLLGRVTPRKKAIRALIKRIRHPNNNDKK